MPRFLLPLLAGLLIISGAAWLWWQQPPPAAPLPLARPGPAWNLVQQRLAQGLAGLNLPPAGLNVDLVVETDTNGMITATSAQVAGTAAPVAVTRLITAATHNTPFALAGPPGRYRLWLKLVPPVKGKPLEGI